MAGRFVQAFKALTQMRHSGTAPLFWAMLPGTNIDWKKKVGTGMDSSVVTAPVQWIQRAFPEAPLEVVKVTDDEPEAIDGHPMVEMVDNPNPFYSGDHLWAATLASYLTTGNAYWLKVRNGNLGVTELWYVPGDIIEPKWPDGGDIFIDHYEYKPVGQALANKLEPKDVVHFRHGIDPANLRKGVSPLHGVIREVYGDLEASAFVATLLKNMGVPGLVLSPAGDAELTEDEAKASKAWLKEAFGGDRRGDPMVMSKATKVEQYGFDPKSMDLSTVRNTAEERVCAELGIPAAVVGFGTGMQQTKVGATMKELRKLAWQNGIMPLQRTLAKELKRSLLPDFSNGKDDGLDVGFDHGKVNALSEDEDARATRFNSMLAAGAITVAEHRRAMGFDADPSHEIYLRGFSVLEVPTGLTPVPPEPAQPAPAEPPKEQKDDDVLARRLGKRPSRKPTRAQARYNAAVERSAPALEKRIDGLLVKFFNAMGKDAGAVAARVLKSKDAPLDSKDVAADRALTSRIVKGMDMAARILSFREIVEAFYLEVAKNTAKHGELIGLGTGLPDDTARAIVATGGTRAGLVDLNGQTKTAIFNAITEGRAAGEGADALARRIRETVPGGPRLDAKTRARLIARTETKFAQNISTVERAKDAGVDQFIVFDARLGDTDEECEAINGTIVSAAEAQALAASEHPNGTRSFSPHFG